MDHITTSAPQIHYPESDGKLMVEAELYLSRSQEVPRTFSRWA